MMYQFWRLMEGLKYKKLNISRTRALIFHERETFLNCASEVVFFSRGNLLS